jgi:hypothetical protein
VGLAKSEVWSANAEVRLAKSEVWGLPSQRSGVCQVIGVVKYVRALVDLVRIVGSAKSEVW